MQNTRSRRRRAVPRPRLAPQYLRKPSYTLPELPETPGSRLQVDPARRRAWARLAATFAGDPAAAPPAAPQGPVLRLVHRITQGFQLAEYERARALGYRAYLEEQLDPEALDDSETEARLANFPTLACGPKEILDAFLSDPFIPLWDLKGAAVVRAVHSRRQLFERMVEFWSDHFNIDHQKELQFALKTEDDREVIRRHALGRFPELLRASARSGAMMFYLDNWINVVGAPQENYARELMELHTLGVDGGYTENDVKEVARTLTGWSLELDESSPDFLRFRFQPLFHDPGTKFVLGETLPGGEIGGEILLQRLAMHPSTARHLATKLARRFLSETPPEGVVDEATAVYLATGGDIRAVLRVLLDEPNLTAAGAYAPKFRRPFHLVTSLLRGLGAEVYDPLYLTVYMALMGHSPFDWGPPNGYPDTAAAWGSSILPRWRFLADVMTGFLPGVAIGQAQVSSLLGGFGRHGLASRLNRNVLGGALSPPDLARFDEFLAAGEPLIWPEVYEAIGLAASAPGFQWY